MWGMCFPVFHVSCQWASYPVPHEHLSKPKLNGLLKLTAFTFPGCSGGPGRRQLTLLSGGHGRNPAWWPVSARVWCNTGASIVVAVRCHGEGQGLKVSADLLCQVSAQVGGIAVGLPFSISERAGAKVSSSLGVLERRANKGFERT